MKTVWIPMKLENTHTVNFFRKAQCQACAGLGCKFGEV